MRFIMKPLTPPTTFTVADGIDFVTKQPELLEHINGAVAVSADEKTVLDTKAGTDTSVTGFDGLTVTVE
ncbi:MAG: hypothetical protein V4440_03385 [Pseudomonadota bacterium]